MTLSTQLVFKASYAHVSEDVLGRIRSVRHPARSCGGALVPRHPSNAAICPTNAVLLITFTPSEGESRCRECSCVLGSAPDAPTFLIQLEKKLWSTNGLELPLLLA